MTGWICNGYQYFSVNGKNVREHIQVAEKALGKKLPPKAVVHHVNENKLDNSNANLVICPNDKYHKLIHQRMKALAACGQADWRKCPYCHQYDNTENMRGEKSGRFVHRKCSADSKKLNIQRTIKNDIHI